MQISLLLTNIFFLLNTLLFSTIAMWHRAKKVTLSAGQIEVKIDFPLPIIACNLMFEYTDFYENLQVSFIYSVMQEK